jgi:hypothetical protein
MAREIIDWDVDELLAAMHRGGPPTVDDTWVAADGRRLETTEDVLAHLVDIGILPASERPAS